MAGSMSVRSTAVSKQSSTEFFRRLKVFWNFCRPHTIIGTSLQVLTAYFLVTCSLTWFLGNLRFLFFVWMSSVAVNIYVVGLNQIFDEKIDKINKPFLPLASGELSKSTAWSITLLMAA